MQDTHTKKIGDKQGHTDETREPILGGDNAEALKITASDDITVRNKYLVGGREDCLDVVRTGTLVFSDSILKAGKDTRTFITAKGGGVCHTYERLRLHGRTRWPWHISLGDWTLYNANPDFPPLRKVIIDDVVSHRGRLVVLQLYCDRVEVRNCRAIVINLRWFAPVLFWVWRKVRRVDPLSAQPAPSFIR